MPKLDDATRKSIDERLAIHDRICKSFEGNQWISQNCFLCNWASNGRTLNDAIEVNQEHVKAEHPVEKAAMEETEIPLDLLRASFHDHDCDRQLCICRCGCQEGPFCVLVLGPLCGICTTRAGRGDSEHGLKVSLSGREESQP